jgi:gliding motility-associated-like protein
MNSPFHKNANKRLAGSMARLLVFLFSISSVQAQNDPPVITGTTSSTFTENQSSVTLIPDLTITDTDDTQLIEAIITTTPYLPGEDIIAISNSGLLSQEISPDGSRITLTGVQDISEYEAVIRRLTYRNTSEDPDVTPRVISVRVTDNSSDASAAFEHTITVNAVNDPPTVTTISGNLVEAIEIDEDTPPQSEVLVPAFSDIDSELAFTIVNISGSSPSIFANGFPEIRNDNQLRFELADNIFGSATVRVRATETNGTSSVEGEYEITVLPVNDPARFSFDPSANPLDLLEDFTGPIDVLIDPAPVPFGEEGETATYSLNISGNAATVELKDDILVIESIPDANGTVRATVTSNEGNLDFSRTLVINVKAVDDPPEISISPSLTLTEDKFSREIVSIDFTDPPTDEQDQEVQLFLEPDRIPFADVKLDTVNGPPRLLVGVVPDGNGRQEFTLLAQDESGNTGSAFFTLIINPVNDAPQLNNLERQLLVYEEGQPGVGLSDSIRVLDVDNTTLTGASISLNNYVQGEDTLLFSAEGVISAAWDNTNGTLTLSGEASLAAYQQALRTTAYANNSDNPEARRTVEITVTDGDRVSNRTNREILVTGTNTPPVVESFAVTTVEDSLYRFTASEFTSRYSDAEQAGLRQVQISRLPVNGLLFLGSTQLTRDVVETFTLTPSLLGALRYEPDSDFNGADSLEWLASDGNRFSLETALIRFTVEPRNDAPSVSGNSAFVSNRDTLIITTSQLPFSDVDGDSLRQVLITESPSQGQLFVNGSEITAGDTLVATDTLLYIPNRNFSGNTGFSWIASDGTLFSASAAEFTIRVRPTNSIPVIEADTVLTIFANDLSEPFSFVVEDADDEANEIDVQVRSANLELIPNENVRISAADSLYSLTLITRNEVGNLVLSILVNDGKDSARQEVQVRIVPKPMEVILPDTILACAREEITLSPDITGGIRPFRYRWTCSGSDCTLKNDTLAEVTLQTPRETRIVLEVTDSLGQFIQTEQDIFVRPSPKVEAGGDVVLDGQQKSLNASIEGDFVDYEWTPINNLIGINSLNPTVLPFESVTYTLTATGSNGCLGSDTVRAFVELDLDIPTGFTPGGDGINDTWDIRNINLFDQAKVEVYSREGEQVFFTENQGEKWDGTLNNQPLPTGSYFYIITLNEGEQVYKGVVTLLR